MRFYLWMKQKGGGCDYTIGCGECLVTLKATSLDEALAELPRTFEDHGVRGESELEECLLLQGADVPTIRVWSYYTDYLAKADAARREEEIERKQREIARMAAEVEKLKRKK